MIDAFLILLALSPAAYLVDGIGRWFANWRRYHYLGILLAFATYFLAGLVVVIVGAAVYSSRRPHGQH